MNDPVVRAVVVLTVVGLVSAAAGAVRNGMVLRRRPMNLPYGGVVIFVSEGCASCAKLRSNLAAAGVAAVTVVDWDDAPERFLEAGIERVPTLANLGGDGRGWAVAGVPSAGRLRRWLRDP